MKKVIAISLISLSFAICSCDEPAPSVPTVTWSQDIEVNEVVPTPYGPVFRAKKGHILWDKNRRCPNKQDSYFKITKPYETSNIATWDECENCGKSWFDHRKD